MDQTNEDAITRSEEELGFHVHTRVVGRVRLRKRIVSETVQLSVEVRREELELVHEEAGEEFDDGSPLAEDVHTVVLSAEEPVVSMGVKPVERVHVHKELVTEQHEMVADVRREQVEVERVPPTAG
ncbi:MAG: DUF2382 domain-containing protein [Solirubrobacterales bacterium]|jgi:stress response protein YsnF|nr:DUF2382 domain-containing protein [Solirubrobacterales bacterium]